jgi:carboxypeptidase Q
MNYLRSPRGSLLPRLLALGWLSFVLLGSIPLAAADAVAPVTPAPAVADALALDKKVLAEATKGSEIMANLTHLSDVIGPRLTGSAALKRANEWAADKMRSYGLSNVRLEGWTIPVAWERGPASVRIVEPDNGRALMVAAMGWTPGTDGRILGDVVVLNARNSAELATYKGKLKGAIVLRGAPAQVRPVADTGRPPERNTSGGRGGRSTSASAATKEQKPEEKPDPRRTGPSLTFRREMSEFLRKEGAAVLLMDAGKPHGLLTTTGGWRGDDRVSSPDPLPSLFVAHEHYALLYRLASRPGSARTRVEVEVVNKLIPGPILVYNTVGELRGSEKPDEYVVLGAHLDSWDLGQGTTDNGTGTSVVLEAARLLARSGVRPRRTIRFVLFTGEEQGLHGSKEYVKRHKEEMARTSMALVHDTGTGRVLGIGLQGRAAVKPILEAELVSLKDLGVTEIDLRGMGGTDHLSFEQAGVPGFAVRQDPAEYRLSHHSQSDTLDKAREPDLIQGAQVMAVTALRVANLPDLLPRDKPARTRAQEKSDKKVDPYPVEFAVDVSDAPEMKEWAEMVARICERQYPLICEALKSEGYKPPQRVRLVLKSSYRGVAEVSGDRITGSVKYFKAHPDDVGAIVHETVHVVQGYRTGGNPVWLVEGIADYIRFFQYEPGKLGDLNPERVHFNGSYRVTAAFLDYLTEKYDKAIVNKLNKVMRAGEYKEEVFKQLTGKTVQELDTEWRASLRR